MESLELIARVILEFKQKSGIVGLETDNITVSIEHSYKVDIGSKMCLQNSKIKI